MISIYGHSFATQDNYSPGHFVMIVRLGLFGWLVRISRLGGVWFHSCILCRCSEWSIHLIVGHHFCIIGRKDVKEWEVAKRHRKGSLDSIGCNATTWIGIECMLGKYFMCWSGWEVWPIKRRSSNMFQGFEKYKTGHGIYKHVALKAWTSRQKRIEEQYYSYRMDELKSKALELLTL